MTGVISGWALLDNATLWMMPVVLLVTISLIDDIRGLKVRWRLAGQLLVAACVVAYLMPATPIWLVSIFILAVAWMLNLYNFMDGSDGLSGGMAVFGFAAYAFAASLTGQVQFAALCSAVSAASLAFLLFNFYPARIFMGDAGSIPLGFLAGAFGIFGWQQGIWPLWFPLLVFSAFIFDASLTLIKRTLRGEKVWEAHRSHYYQRLVQMGWGHRKTAIVEYGLMLATAGSALAMIDQRASLVGVALIGWLLAYALLAYLIDRAWKSFNSR